MKQTHFALITGLSLMLAGCASSPEPKLYFLDQSIAPSQQALNNRRIGFSEITLPAYARNVQITNLSSDNMIREDDDHRWASPPAEAISVALSQSLEATTGSAVVIRPYPREVEPELQIRVTFNRFLRGANGAADMQGQYLIVLGEDDPTTMIKRFSIRIPAEGSGYAGYMKAVSMGLRTLAGYIATDIEAIG